MEGRVTLKFGVRTKNDHHYIMYDEFDILFEADIAIDQEVLVGNIHSFKIVMSEHTDKRRTTPVFDTLDTTEEQYEQFWKRARAMERRLQGSLNRVLQKGIPLPYWNLSFLTQFTFHHHAMLVVMDIFYNNLDVLKH